MAVVDPLSWSVLPFGDQTAWVDFLGSHALWFASVVQHVRQNLGGAPIALLPLGDGGGAEWMDADQLAHDSTSDSLGVPRGPDLRSYDLGEAAQFASWAFLHANDCVRLRQAALL